MDIVSLEIYRIRYFVLIREAPKRIAQSGCPGKYLINKESISAMSTKVVKNKKEQKERKKINPIFIILGVLAVAILIVVIVFIAMRESGKHRLYSKATSAEVTDGDFFDTEKDIEYNGHTYHYNKDIMTFLVLGIDTGNALPTVDENTNYHQGGQSDAIFLFVMNPHDKTISVVAVNRNTMTDIYICDEHNNYVKTAKAQICVQHGYGDGLELSCERSRQAVSGLMYGLPINGYVSIRLHAIATLNDMLGGVEVTLPSDFPELGLSAGTTVRLDGEQAYTFVKFRDVTVFNSAGTRLENEKVYLKAFMKQVYDITKTNITFPVGMYQQILDYTVTDITVDEMMYLASELLGYSVLESKIYTLPGETQKVNAFEEFHVDEQGLKETILDIFYEITD